MQVETINGHIDGNFNLTCRFSRGASGTWIIFKPNKSYKRNFKLNEIAIIYIGDRNFDDIALIYHSNCQVLINPKNWVSRG